MSRPNPGVSIEVSPVRESQGNGRWWVLIALAPIVLLCKALWFSASAVIPQLLEERSLSGGEQALLTVSVQLGFVFGALIIALTNLADRLAAPRLIGLSALLGALLNALIVLTADQLGMLLLLRFLTGATLAGVYPPGMKLLATWFVKGRGLAIGVMVGALTAGSASPHLLNVLPGGEGGGLADWRTVLLLSSASAFLGGTLALILLREGPHGVVASRFDWRYASKIFTDRPLRLANFGYLGHQWELYAVWAWAPLLVRASYLEAGWSERGASLLGFGLIAIGAVGSVLAGLSGDRFGRTLTAGTSLVLSGLCCLLVGLFFSMPLALTLLCLFWGFVVVADSAQFSAAISELCDRRYIGTALTMQTCSGFLLTALTIRLMPLFIDWVGWRWAFCVLAPGPIFGLASMIRLRRLPDAVRMAHGNR